MMKNKILIIISMFNMLIGALLCAFIMKDTQITAPEAAMGLVWLLSMNAVAVATAHELKKKPAGEKKVSRSLTLLNGGMQIPNPRKPAA